MRDDFAAFILTHGRPDDILTTKTLRQYAHYTGKIYYVVDDEDPSSRDRTLLPNRRRRLR